MEIDIIFKAAPSTEVFKDLGEGWYLAPTDQDTFKYTLQNVRSACSSGLDGIKLKVRNFKYTDPKMLWASINIDKIIAELNPGGSNVTNWLSDTLDIVGNDSSSIIDSTKEMGVWIDENDMSIIIDAWKDHKVKDKEDYNTIFKIVTICTDDHHIVSTSDAMEVIRQYNKMSNSIVSAFTTADIQGMLDVAKEQFDCELEIMIDTNEIKEDTPITTLPKQVKETIWKILVRNRGKIEKLGFNVDTNSMDIEIYKLETYKDAKGQLILEDVIVYDCDIKNAMLKKCIVFKSTLNNCSFEQCKTLGIRVKLKECKNYKDEIEGQYTIIDEDEDEDEE